MCINIFTPCDEIRIFCEHQRVVCMGAGSPGLNQGLLLAQLIFFVVRKIPEMKVKGLAVRSRDISIAETPKLRETNNFGDCGSLHFCD